MNLASIILAGLLSLVMTACTSSSIPHTEVSSQNLTEAVESAESSPMVEEVDVEEENPYSEITNDFLKTTDELGVTINKTKKNGYIDAWNDENHESALRYTRYPKSGYGYGILSNEDYSRNVVLWIDIFNPNKENFEEVLNTLDWHPVSTGSIEGYILTEDSVILVNTTQYYDDYEQDGECYELYNLNALATVMGIDIQEYVANVSSMEDAFDIMYGLEEAAYLGTRGYESYLNYNPQGIITDNFDSILVSLNNPYDALYKDVYPQAYNLPEYDDSEIYGDDDSETSGNSVYDYALDPDAGYDFSHEPENWSELIQGMEALNENLYNHFWDIADANINQ